ncbi:MAG: hypothetical protein HY959_01480 [Ignavibacteriae bacterium]|nr:hypothetical protein [Ignavibacteriota bacterium]
MRKKILWALIAFITFTGITLAQEGPPVRKNERDKPNAEEMIKKELNMLKHELALTETQEVFIKKILEESLKKIETQMESGEKNIGEVEKLMNEKDEKIKSVLTDEQTEKFNSLKSRKEENFKEGDRPPKRKG